MSGRLSNADRKTRREYRRAFKEIRHVYRCNLCRWHVVTVQLDAGVVPDSIACRNPAGCTSPATERIGDPRPWPQGVPWLPEYEWTEPTIKEMDDSQRHGGWMWEHLSQRGLMLRPRAKRRR